MNQTKDELQQEIELRKGLDGLTSRRIATLYRRAPLIRPVDDLDRLWTMFENSTLVISAWYDGRLVGIARVLTDHALYSYLCDLAVEPDVQRLGIGKSLISEVLEECKNTDLVLRDSDISSRFYEKLGFEHVDNAWVWTRSRSVDGLIE